MGLDMHLEKEIYIGAQYEHRNITGTISLKHDGKEIKINNKKVSYIVEEVMYWRKANAIHNWFVQNVQDGIDECQRAWVSTEKLKELVETCKSDIETIESSKDFVEEKLTNHNEKEIVYNRTWDKEKLNIKLVPTSGFFFGSTNIDEYFLDDLKETVEVLEEELKNSENENLLESNYYYKSSW